MHLLAPYSGCAHLPRSCSYQGVDCTQTPKPFQLPPVGTCLDNTYVAKQTEENARMYFLASTDTSPLSVLVQRSVHTIMVLFVTNTIIL